MGQHLEISSPPTKIKKTPLQSGSLSKKDLTTINLDTLFQGTLSDDVIESVLQHASAIEDPNKWWTRHRCPLLCPLTQFPVCLLPYPPFKLRMAPGKSAYNLVDGKYLALQLIVNYGSVSACGRQVQASDIKELDHYLQRCKLGPFRPYRVFALIQECSNPYFAEEGKDAMRQLQDFQAAAQAELGKLRHIQANRLVRFTAKSDEKPSTFTPLADDQKPIELELN